MVRLIALLALVSVIAGCRNAPQTFENPFLGRTTVPPPGTAIPGTLPGAYDPNAGNAPLFDPNTSSPAAAAPATLTPSAQGSPGVPPPAGLPQYGPPGGFEFRQMQVTPAPATQYGTFPPPPPAAVVQPSVITSPSQARWGNGSASTDGPQSSENLVQQHPAGSAVAAASATQQFGSAERAGSVPGGDAIRISGAPSARIERAAGAGQAAAGSGPSEPGRLPTDGDVIDITDLPPAGSQKTAQRIAPTVSRTSYLRGVEPTGSVDPAVAAVPPRVAPAPATSQASYGHGSDYAWLKGQLEYSHIDRRWKLRYIPIDGQTDAHGGSVMLPDSPLLDGFESGDFVTVQGALGQRSASRFAPEYELTRVKRLDP